MRMKKLQAFCQFSKISPYMGFLCRVVFFTACLELTHMYIALTEDVNFITQTVQACIPEVSMTASTISMPKDRESSEKKYSNDKGKGSIKQLSMSGVVLIWSFQRWKPGWFIQRNIQDLTFMSTKQLLSKWVYVWKYIVSWPSERGGLISEAADFCEWRQMRSEEWLCCCNGTVNMNPPLRQTVRN